MRPKFFELLYEAMKKDDQIWLLVGDLGYGGADKIREDFPDRFINTGAAESRSGKNGAAIRQSMQEMQCILLPTLHF